MLFKLYIERWFFWEEAVSGQSGNDIDQEVIDRPVACMLDFADVLELIIDRFDQGPFPEQDFVGLAEVLVFHVLLWFGDELYAVTKQKVRKCLGNIALVCK